MRLKALGADTNPMVEAENRGTSVIPRVLIDYRPARYRHNGEL